MKLLFSVTLPGQCVSGKNQIVRPPGRKPFPNPRFKKWRSFCSLLVSIAKNQAGRDTLPIPYKVAAVIRYTPGDLRTRDISGIQDAIFHLLGYCQVVTDDGLIVDMDFKTLPLNRKFPSVTIELHSIRTGP